MEIASETFEKSIIKRVFSPEMKLDAALDASHGTIRFADEYPAFHATNGITVHEIYRMSEPAGGIRLMYTEGDGVLKFGRPDTLFDAETRNKLADYAVKVALRLDRMSVNGIFNPKSSDMINNALAKHITRKIPIGDILTRYYTDEEVVRYAESGKLGELLQECEDNLGEKGYCEIA